MQNDLDGYIEPGSVEEELVNKIDFSRIPKHVAVIMDGNGRWAKQRKLPRVEGHKEGERSVKEIVEASARLGIKYLTLYAFSKENWKRPRSEVATLWRLLEDYLKREFKVLLENNLCLRVIGQTERIPKRVMNELNRVMDLTQDNKRMTIFLALNYGGRAEIIDAIKKLIKERKKSIDSLNEKEFSKYLYTGEAPDPDLLIRTSGELRVSNFLLWQIAYSEIWITSELWPDFRKKHLFQAVCDYQKRERRFGDIRPHSLLG
ncbi:MAG: isoprenyl transferase [Candidatus Aminicenantes bacterium]|nr:isoprenyl transferase [Candidatus Aminicenantes bacterium]